MKLKKLLFLSASLFALMTSSAYATTHMRLAHSAAAGNPKDLASIKFAELVEQYTEGRIKVDVGGNSRFADDAEALTNMRLGTLEFSANSQGTTSGIVKEFALIGLPFLFKDLNHTYKVMDGAVGEELNRYARQKGLEVLAIWDNGFRHTSNNAHPILTPEEMKGLKIRTPPDPMTLDIMRALGANPAPLAFSELYIALQQGVFDGQENPLMNIYFSKLYEVQKYISLTGHTYQTTPLLVSKRIWDKLSEQDKDAVKRAAEEAKNYNRQLSMQSDSELTGKLQELGVKINEINQAQFVEATKPVYDKWTKTNKAFAQLLLDEVQKAAQ
ncbi:TRAP transporter substrate-binding protein [Conservatibacter flavescens]|uniref:C4-dicarboxylate ABC transporter n=1 Tax=Conservatibacter flavescens TaxID=28161 RepID=A0A2M8S504_9PAST|nr:TRAP transporter substrate-binding protein [Conservatibacter flavescens]PJG86178.1 C4-dicarboxylate ABC transporter [Conservatibacter flavescens]